MSKIDDYKVRPQDDLRHAPFGKDPFMMEAWYFNILDPKLDIAIFLRIGLWHHKGHAESCFMVSNNDREVYNKILKHQPMPVGNIDSGVSLGGVTFTAEKLLESYRLTGGDPEFGMSLDVLWNGLHPTIDGNINVPSKAGYAHLEQHGKVSGTFTYRGKEYKIDGYGTRDHSIGRRTYNTFQGHKLLWATFEDGTYLTCGTFPVSETRTVEMNWVWNKDHLNHEIRTRRFENTYDSAGRTLTALLEVSDGKGTDIKLKGKRRSSCMWPADGFFLEECFFEFEKEDGIKGYGIYEDGRKGVIV